MEIKELITFKTIVETGGYSKAAKKLHYAQSTITGHIKQLEASLGKEIFEKIGRRASLTPYGKELYKNTVELINKYEQIKSIGNDSDKISGDLYIGTPESTMVYKLYHIIQNYRKKFPDVNIIIKSGTCSSLRKDVLQGKLELSFVLEPEGLYDYNENISVEHFTKETMHIVASNDFEGDKLSDLKNCSILNTEAGCAYREMFHKILKDNSIEFTNSMETESVELIKRYVMCNLGITYLPYYAIEKEIEEKKLKIIDSKVENAMYTSIVYHNNRWQSPAMKEFIKLTREFFEAMK